MHAPAANETSILAWICVLPFSRPRLFRCEDAVEPLLAASGTLGSVTQLTFHLSACTGNACFVDPLELVFTELSASRGPFVLCHVDLEMKSKSEGIWKRGCGFWGVSAVGISPRQIGRTGQPLGRESIAKGPPILLHGRMEGS